MPSLKRGKITRRLGENVFGSEKLTKILSRRGYPPGFHGPKRAARRSEYGQQMLMKQKMRYMYGLRERQMRALYEKALKIKGNTGEYILKLLESRIDNVVYRLQLADTRMQARQFVSHGHILLNGRRVDIPSIIVKKGDIIAVRQKSVQSKYFQEHLKKIDTKRIPSWLVWDPQKQQAKVEGEPDIADVQKMIDTTLVIEFYSR